MTNHKVYLIAAVLVFMTPLLFAAELFEIVNQILYYFTPVVITMILLWRKEISMLIRIVMDYFSASNKRSTYSWPKLRFQFPKVPCLVPWNLVLFIFIYVTLIFLSTQDS